MRGQLNTPVQVENAAYRIAVTDFSTPHLRRILKDKTQLRKLRCFAYAELIRRQRSL